MLFIIKATYGTNGHSYCPMSYWTRKQWVSLGVEQCKFGLHINIQVEFPINALIVIILILSHYLSIGTERQLAIYHWINFAKSNFAISTWSFNINLIKLSDYPKQNPNLKIIPHKEVKYHSLRSGFAHCWAVLIFVVNGFKLRD